MIFKFLEKTKNSRLFFSKWTAEDTFAADDISRLLCYTTRPILFKKDLSTDALFFILHFRRIEYFLCDKRPIMRCQSGNSNSGLEGAD